jgi:hypothetical protein
MNLGDLIARTLLLILSGLATLAIFASVDIAAQWSSNAPATSSIRPSPRPADATQEAGIDSRPAPASEGQEKAASETSVGGSGGAAELVAVQAAGANQVARWLQALTYAVLALAGFAAAALIALLRIGSHLARIADRHGA